jgi:hypothetical protein
MDEKGISSWYFHLPVDPGGWFIANGKAFICYVVIFGLGILQQG